MEKKLKSAARLRDRIRKLKKEGCRIVFTNGCFDILHVGHIRYLRQAAALGDVLVVGLNSDRSVRSLKGESRPYVPEAERAEMLAALEMVDLITIFDEDTPRELIAGLEPDVLVKGGDWDLSRIVGSDTVIAAGGEVVAVDEVPGRSTTSLIDEIIASRRKEVEI